MSDLVTIGAIIGAVTCVGGIIVRDRMVLKAIKDGDEALHHRINEVQQNYVRRDDFNEYARRVEKSIDNVHTEIKGTNGKVEQVLISLAKLNKNLVHDEH